MKKALIISITIILIVALCGSFVSCKQRVEIKREIIDTKFTPAHTETSTSIDLAMYILFDIPLIKVEPRFIPDKYEILYLITYDNGDQNHLWLEVTQAEYEEVGHNGTSN